MVELEARWFDEILDAIYQYTWILDPSGVVIKVNQIARELTDCNQENMAGVPFWSVPWAGLSRQNRQTLKRAVSQVILGESTRQELEIYRRKQPSITIHFSFKPILTENGELQFIIVEGRDITGYKRMTEALDQSEARFKTIFEEAGIGIVIKNINGKMLNCNPAFHTMLGYTAEELLRLDYLDITHPMDKRLSRKLFNELVNGKRKSYVIEKRYLHKDGQPIWVRITASPVLESDRQSQFVIAMVENITATKAIESELSELQRRSMHGREMERLRIAQDLHDGPLQELIDVIYQLQGLDEAQSEGARHEQQKNIQVAVHQLARSIRTICGELRPPTLIPFGVGKTIKSHAEQFQEAYPELTIHLDLDEDGQTLSEPVRIVLFRIYQAALSNIVRHAQAKLVKIRFRLNERQATLKIQDNGKGFELPDRWINLARQGHLGIVGAMERAKEVGGNLKVTSRPGRGTVIQIVIPLNKE